MSCIVNKYNNICHSTIKMKPVDVSQTQISISKKKENPQFKVGCNGRILKYKNIFEKGYIPNWSKKVLVIKKVKKMFCGNKVLVILMVKKMLEYFIKKNCKETSQRHIWIEKVVKNKGNKLYVEWKGCDN